ncbi:unnamed protein product [Ectocarpus sp. 8 AP-2014]
MLNVALGLGILGMSHRSSFLRCSGPIMNECLAHTHTRTRFRRGAPQIHSFDADVGLLPQEGRALLRAHALLLLLRCPRHDFSFFCASAPSESECET